MGYNNWMADNDEAYAAAELIRDIIDPCNRCRYSESQLLYAGASNGLITANEFVSLVCKRYANAYTTADQVLENRNKALPPWLCSAVIFYSSKL